MDKKDYKKMNMHIKPSKLLIEQTKRKAREIESRPSKNTGGINMKFRWKQSLIGTAVAFTVFVGAVNMSPVFANSIQGVPVLGSLARVVSVNTYAKTESDKNISVNQPIVNDELADINNEIEKAIDDYKKSADKDIAEYKDAYISTGGTEEEFKAKDIQVVVNHEIKSQNENYLSFVLTMYQSWNASFAQYKYCNLDSKTGKKLDLSDLLGENYIDIANNSIKNQIADQNSSSTDPIYFESGKGGFETIGEDTNFYINEDGNPVIVFAKYEIAAGAYGRPEFEIDKSVK